jgi:hypothetical protein
MGSCNSTKRAFESAGAFVGSAILGGVAAVTLNPLLATAAVGAFGGGIALTKEHNGCDKSKKGLIEATNSIITSAITNSFVSCMSEVKSLQYASVTCHPNLDTLAVRTDDPKRRPTVFEENQECTNCIESAFRGLHHWHELEERRWLNTSNEVAVITSFDKELATMTNALEVCGMQSCKACNMVNVTQSNTIDATQGCTAKIDLETKFKNNLTGIITQELTNNQDVLSAAAKVLGTDGLGTLTQELTNRISTHVTKLEIDAAILNIQSTQRFTYSGQAGSVGGISQVNAFNVVQQYVTDSKFSTKAVSDVDFQSMADILNKQNTMDSLGNLVFHSTVDLTEAINSAAGQFMMFTVGILAVLFLAIFSYLAYKGFYKTAAAGVVSTAEESKNLLEHEDELEAGSTELNSENQNENDQDGDDSSDSE